MILVVDVGTTGLRAAVDATRRDDRARRVPAVRARQRRSPGWSSSTPPDMAELVLDAGHAALAAAGNPTHRRRRHHQPAGEHDRVGARHRPPDRSRRSAGRTCARSASASPPRPSTGCSSPPTSRRPRSAGCSPTPSAAAARRPLLRHGRHMDRVDAVGGRAARHRPLQRRRHRPLFDRRRGDGTAVCASCSASRSAMLPAIVDSSGVIGAATALPGAPPIAALVGDQQASLAGQGCVAPGQAKITFGTGGMLDICTGTAAPAGPTVRTTGRSRSSPGASPARSRGASRRSCCRPAPTSNGCATTWG